MNVEVEIPNRELYPLANQLAKTFIQRRDLYARQLEDGSYVCIRQPLKDWHLVAHLKGEITLGAYVLDEGSQARYIVMDADDDLQMERLMEVALDLAGRDVPSYLEASRRGGHLWLFFDQPVIGKEARTFGRGLIQAYELGNIELFPKQDRLKTGPGSLIRLPFGVHRKSGQRYDFCSPDGRPLGMSMDDQIRALSAPQTVPETVFERVLNWVSNWAPKEVPESSGSTEGSLSERIKDSMTVLEFVSQYVQLSPNGRGLCPFHDDQRASFSVNTDENYWHCFAGCGGGSLIDFWMKYRDCDYKTAVRELSDQCL
jgi:hypothetical protein